MKKRRAKGGDDDFLRGTLKSDGQKKGKKKAA
jgi:hypothetical protein